MPAGLLVTVPVPEPARETVSAKELGGPSLPSESGSPASLEVSIFVTGCSFASGFASVAASLAKAI